MAKTAKSLPVSLSFAMPASRGVPEMSVAEALEYEREYIGRGEGLDDSELIAELVIRMARRDMALNKDGERWAAGKLASRVYGMRTPEDAPAAIVKAAESYKEAATATLEKLAKKAPAKKASAKKAPAKKAPAKKASAKKSKEAATAETATA